MKMRAPAYPLVTIDPYISIWSATDRLNQSNTIHWSGKENKMFFYAEIDGVNYILMGDDGHTEKMEQISVDVKLFSTIYQFHGKGVNITLTFTNPLLIDDIYLLSRPVAYLKVDKIITDDKVHSVNVKLFLSENICKEDLSMDVTAEKIVLSDSHNAIKMGMKNQNVLSVSGDMVNINWGYLYLTSRGNVLSYTHHTSVNDKVVDERYICSEITDTGSEELFLIGYDDIKSIEYFGNKLTSYWNKKGEKLADELVKACSDYADTMKKCSDFEEKLLSDALNSGGEKYAELLLLAYRQVLSAHKVAVDNEGNILYISKECSSNGCGATVDVSYPSMPLFLIYNPQLVKAMMRPIYKYALSDKWKNQLKYDFAPHDCGQYPLLNGQFYGDNFEMQMPCEECGNMIIMETAVAIATHSTDFFDEHRELIDKWVKYLVDNGFDPMNQLCTDDFAGHLSHNCNLSLKAIMGIMGLGIIYKMKGDENKYNYYHNIAKEMADSFVKRGKNSDTGYRLAYDKDSTFSIKYNLIWDDLWGTNLIDEQEKINELNSYQLHFNEFGLPLDSRANYTKTDWYMWVASMIDDKEQFIKFIEPMWNMYDKTKSRIPMTDWYDTITGESMGFKNRTVQGGLFMKLLKDKKIMKIKI